MRHSFCIGFFSCFLVWSVWAGQPAIVTPTGNFNPYITIPSSRVEQIDPAKRTDQPEDPPFDWQTELRVRVTETERLMQADPPTGADKLQQVQFQTEVNEKIHQQFTDLPGKMVNVPFVVTEMIERTPPQAPSPLQATASSIERRMYEDRCKAFQATMVEYKKYQYCVVGRVPWQQPVHVMPLEWRKKLAALKPAERVKTLKDWRDACPEHFVAFYASKEQVGHWKPGHARRVVGLVQAAAQICRIPKFRTYYGVSECRYVQMDLFVVPTQLIDNITTPIETGGGNSLPAE